LLLLFLIAWICSLYLVRNALPVCPMYLSGQSKQFIWKTLLSFYLSFCGLSFAMFRIVFCILNAIFLWVSLNFFGFFFLHVNVVHFSLCYCGFVVVFCFCFCMDSCFIISFMLYLLLCSGFL
jgi:hypothetical protein